MSKFGKNVEGLPEFKKNPLGQSGLERIPTIVPPTQVDDDSSEEVDKTKSANPRTRRRAIKREKAKQNTLKQNIPAKPNKQQKVQPKQVNKKPQDKPKQKSLRIPKLGEVSVQALKNLDNLNLQDQQETQESKDTQESKESKQSKQDNKGEQAKLLKQEISDDSEEEDDDVEIKVNNNNNPPEDSGDDTSNEYIGNNGYNGQVPLSPFEEQLKELKEKYPQHSISKGFEQFIADGLTRDEIGKRADESLFSMDEFTIKEFDDYCAKREVLTNVMNDEVKQYFQDIKLERLKAGYISTYKSLEAKKKQLERYIENGNEKHEELKELEDTYDAIRTEYFARGAQRPDKTRLAISNIVQGLEPKTIRKRIKAARFITMAIREKQQNEKRLKKKIIKKDKNTKNNKNNSKKQGKKRSRKESEKDLEDTQLPNEDLDEKEPDESKRKLSSEDQYEEYISEVLLDPELSNVQKNRLIERFEAVKAKEMEISKRRNYELAKETKARLDEASGYESDEMEEPKAKRRKLNSKSEKRLREATKRAKEEVTHIFILYRVV